MMTRNVSRDKLSKDLKAARLFMRLSLEKISNDTGIDIVDILNIESNTKGFDIKLWETLSRYYNGVSQGGYSETNISRMKIFLNILHEDMSRSWRIIARELGVAESTVSNFSNSTTKKLSRRYSIKFYRYMMEWFEKTPELEKLVNSKYLDINGCHFNMDDCTIELLVLKASEILSIDDGSIDFETAIGEAVLSLLPEDDKRRFDEIHNK